MESKSENDKNSKKIEKKNSKEKKMIDWKWIITISVIAFFISLAFSFFGEVIIPNVHLVFSILILILFIFLGIMFDVIGVAVTVADQSTFNSMAAKKIKGASLAVRLIKNSNKASSFMNDVIGDICGVISGSTGLSIAIIINSRFNLNLLVTTLVITALVSTLTIGGKAIGKTIAISKCDKILFGFVRILSTFYKE